MNYQLMPEPGIAIQRLKRRRINPVYHFPSVSIFLPFNPKMEMKNKLTFLLSKATDKAISELRDKYPGEMAMLVIQKLRAIIKNLNFSTHKKSVAIFVSPVFQKVYYLNIDLEENVIVNESFQILDIINSKKQSQQFHILLLKDNESRIFFNASNSFVRILPADRVAENSSRFAGSSLKEILMKEFLEHIDYSLNKILKYSRLPVVVIGAAELLNQFKNVTRHSDAIIEYLQSDDKVSSFEDVNQILNSNITNWQEIKQKYLLAQLHQAAKNNRIATGIENVWRAVLNGREQMLIIEKRNWYDTIIEEKKSWDYEMHGSYDKFSCIRNPIDEMIEKVLEKGGNVELVSNGFLQEYAPVVLIKNF
jgi:hypothetical protein